MEKFLEKKFVVPTIIFIIMAGAFAVRFYHFHDWLYFKMDQSRDAFLIGNAVKNGPEYLPLLGARAGATEVSRGFLRLGPAFYYFQYLSGVLFNSTKPDVFAYPDLFFSLLTIPLLYVFSRLYFSRQNSILIAAMYSFSFIIIQYSRFAWNCNSLQFFAILSFYGLLRFLNEPDAKKSYRWLALWSLGMAVGSQLHFFGFFGLVGISGLLILISSEIWEKRRLRTIISKAYLSQLSKYVLVALGVFMIIYAPVIISDTMKHGENSLNFIEALHTKPAPQPLIQKITKNITEEMRYYTLILSSYVYGDNKNLNAAVSLSVLALMLAGLGLTVQNLRKKKLEKNQKNFLYLVLIWTGIFFILSIPVAFQLRPRFFILVFALPFTLLGIIFEFLDRSIKKYSIFLSISLSVSVLLSNATGTAAWFSELKTSELKHAAIKRSLILKSKDGVMLGHLEKAAQWIYSQKRPGARIYYYVKPEHVKPVKYLLHEIDPDTVALPLKINGDPQAQFFAITPSHRGTKPLEDKFKQTFNIVSMERIGQINVWEISFTDQNVNSNFRFNRDHGTTDRLYWKDVFGIKDDTNSIIIDAGE